MAGGLAPRPGAGAAGAAGCWAIAAKAKSNKKVVIVSFMKDLFI
jgi:hypothetical protein